MNKAKEIENLRKLGNSIPEISEKLHLPKSTVFYYAKNVSLSPAAEKRLTSRRNGSRILSDRNWILARQAAKKITGKIEEKSNVLVAPLLYWAEGAKKDFSFLNSDPDMVKVFYDSLIKDYMVSENNIIITIRLHENLSLSGCRKFWANKLGIEIDKIIKADIIKGRKNGKLKYGMCRIRVSKGGLLLKTFVEIVNIIKYARVVQRIEQETPKL